VTVELNVDLGELPDEDGSLYALATVVNVACGGHAGDASTMERALLAAAEAGAAVAAHPSYPDREGFGRRPRFADVVTTGEAVRAQSAALESIASRLGVRVTTMKPHGALYHDANTDRALADAVVDAAARALPALDTIVGPPTGALSDATRARGLRFVREGFADRRYEGDALVPRSRADALLLEPGACVAQALALAASGRFDTLCMHGDTPGAATLVRAVREALIGAGVLSQETRRPSA
jgi:UPF0271 protein